MKVKEKIMKAHYIYIEELDSTNNFLENQLLERELSEGTVVYTMNQHAGRGQGENKWESRPGENITMSLLLCPDFLPAVDQFQLNKAICVGVVDFLKKYLPENVLHIKWPNDIYVEDNKIAGILIEHNIMGENLCSSIVGIGLNVNQTNFSMAENPTSISMETGKEADPEKLIVELTEVLLHAYECLQACVTSCDAEYLSKLYRYDEWNSFVYKEQQMLARILGVNKYGQLLLETEMGELLTCNQKEVKYII